MKKTTSSRKKISKAPAQTSFTKLKPKEKEVVRMEVEEQRVRIKHIVDTSKHLPARPKREYKQTGIAGFDKLLVKGIPRANSVLVCGGPGSGKTIFCLQSLYNAAKKGEKVFYMSFEESAERLRQHMEDFGMKPQGLEKDGKLIIKRFDPFEVTTSVEAMLEKAKGELLIDLEPVLLPDNFRPDWIVVDSLSAIAAAFVKREETYRIYVEQLFKLFEKIKATSLLITETEQIPRRVLTKSGVEEFLADGVVVLYNIMRANIRESAIEVLKMRGAKHAKKIVAMQITDNGIVVYPEQEIYTEVKEQKL